MEHDYELEQWTIQGGANIEEVHPIVVCAAEKVGLAKPGPERTVEVPRRVRDAFYAALDECDENWRDKGLAPPG